MLFYFLSLCSVLNVISVLTLADIDLKEAQRFFAQKFSCGASVTAEDEIIIQGDFTDDIIDVIQEKWPEVSHKFVKTFVVHLTSLFLFPLLPSTSFSGRCRAGF